MATAIIVALRRHRTRRLEEEAVDTDELDADHDGNITAAEIKPHLSKLSISPPKMLERLSVEADLASMLCKLPSFLICMACFVIALCAFEPPGTMHDIHRHIESHFDLEKVLEIKSYEAIYEYMEEFEKQNKDMQATGTKYWCEKRYAKLTWDTHLMAPVWECPSPRQYALSLLNDMSVSWSRLHGFASSSSSSSSSSGSSSSSSSSSSHRRMSSSSGSSGSGELPPCEDKDAMLQEEEADPNVTCANFAQHVCDIDLGILLCPQTCGYCSPFEYRHLKRFGKPQVTLLPTMVYQTRFATDECHFFAHGYQVQPYNPVLTLLPALDGARNGPLLTCIDRGQHLHDDHAFELECPAGSPTTHCHNGTMKVTEKHTFHGHTIYPKLLIEPHRDVLAMKATEWLDLQTEAVTLSTVVYTEGSEVFSSLSVDFSVDAAGNVDGSYELISYRDLTQDARSWFIGGLVGAAVSSLLGLVLTGLDMWSRPERLGRGIILYELFSGVLLLVYALVLLISWTQQVPMAEEFDHLLHSFLDLESLGHADVEEAVQAYFDVKTHMYSETRWLTGHRIAAYLVCYFQFLQLIFYFNAHPKVALLTATVEKAATDIVHFLILFGTLFCMLGFMAHWMLGEHLALFGTVEATLRTQMRMVFGAFIEVDGAGELPSVTLGMYWVYAGTFMVIVWLLLLNFILAIIVEAFAEVKGENSSKVVVRDFPSDVLSVFYVAYLRRRHGWPSSTELMKFFENAVKDAEAAHPGAKAALLAHVRGERDIGRMNTEDFQRKQEDADVPRAVVSVPAEDVLRAFPTRLNEETLSQLLCYYLRRAPRVLCQRKRQSSDEESEGVVEGAVVGV